MHDDMQPTPFGPVPKHWQLARVGEVGQVQLGRARSPETDNGPNMVPYLRVANVLDGFIDYSDVYRMHFSPAEQQKYTVRRGDILLNEGQSTELVGRSAIFDGPENRYCFQNSLVNFRAGPAVDQKFARAVFKRWLDIGHFTTIVKQTTSMAHLGGERFAGLTFPVPPLSEQRAVATVLDAVDNAIHKTEQIIAKLQQVKQGLLHDLLIRGIDDNGELRDPDRHPEQFKDSALGTIPRAWMISSLDEIADFVTSGSRGWAAYYADAGALFVRIGNLTREHINMRFDSVQRVQPPDDGEGKRTRVLPGDVLLSITADLGIIGVVPDDLGEAYVNQHIALIRVAAARANSRWIGHYLAAGPPRNTIRMLDDSGAKAGLNLPTVRGLRCSMPPRQEQDEIAHRIDSVDHRITTERRALAKLRLLKQGLMDDLLTGHVRVTPLLEGAAP